MLSFPFSYINKLLKMIFMKQLFYYHKGAGKVLSQNFICINIKLLIFKIEENFKESSSMIKIRPINIKFSSIPINFINDINIYYLTIFMPQYWGMLTYLKQFT